MSITHVTGRAGGTKRPVGAPDTGGDRGAERSAMSNTHRVCRLTGPPGIGVAPVRRTALKTPGGQS